MEVVLLALAGLATFFIGFMLARPYLIAHRQRLYEADSAEALLREGLRLVPDLPSVTTRLQAVLRPLELARPERAFSFNVGGRDAVLYEWRSSYGGWAEDEYWQGYVILGPGAPYLRAMPRAFFGRPSHPIGFPDNPRFSETFWVEGTEEETVRRYLGPELRRFLLAQGRGWGFLAGPEGVALVRRIGIQVTRIRLPIDEGSETIVLFERLATMTQAAARHIG